MGVKVDERVWETALAYCKNGIVRDFKDHSNEVFWREYDLQSRMYGRMFEQTILRSYLRREHRIWAEDGRKQLLVLDLALLDPEDADRMYPHWPVREMIQLKFPVEFITGLTEPQDLTLKEDAPTQAKYIERCRTRIRKKISEDYQKFEKAVGKARNISDSARCHIIYFDLANKPSYLSSEELNRDLRDSTNVDVWRIGSWPLTVRYAHAYPRDRRRSGNEGSRSRGEII